MPSYLRERIEFTHDHRLQPPMNIPLLQTDLKAAGLYTGKIDGIWGPKTEAAWIAWTTVKANRIEGSTFPYDTYRTVTVAFNQTMRTEYVPAMERALVGFTKGMKLLCTVMAHAEGFYPKSTAYKTNNPGNVGNVDTGAHKTFATLDGGIRGQADHIIRVATGKLPSYPIGKEKVLKAWFSPEIARNRKNYAVPTGQLPGYRFVYTGQIDQYVKIYATLPRLTNSYVNQIVSYFAQHGYSIAPESKLAEIIELC